MASPWLKTVFTTLCALSLGCDATHDATVEKGQDALGCVAGDSVACACADGARGTALCLPSQEPAACTCEYARTIPCSSAGALFDCRCGDGRAGTEICLHDGDYTPCACDEALPAQPNADAAITAAEAAGGAASAAACPGGFACTEQQGYLVCTDSSGLPPICKTAPDCVQAGLPDADCLDPGVGGIKLCVMQCHN